MPFILEPKFGSEVYARYALGVPMYYIHRIGKYYDACGASLRDSLVGKLPEWERTYPTEADWLPHIGTLYPEVSLKTFLEQRGADCGSADMVAALSALWEGLLFGK